MNLVIFACEAKGLSSLNSIMNEASERGINLFAMVCQETYLQHPTQNRDKFQILTNCENTNPTYSETLGVTLPFKPDWLLVARERWDPETSIIIEFKQTFECKVGLVEPNSWILGNAEIILEIQSRNRFKDIIDVFFTHSSYQKTLQKNLGFMGNMVLVGNPKYDTNLNPTDKDIQSIKSYYNVDPDRKKVLLFSLVNTNRKKLFKEFEKYVNDNPQYQFYFKPYPGEPLIPQFKNEYFPNFSIKGVTPILEESHIWAMFNVCDIHIGCLSSIFHASLLLNKKIIDFSKNLNIPSQYLEKDHILNSNNVGLEDSKSLWMRSLNITENELLKLLCDKTFEIIKNNNNYIWNSKENLLYLFDDFNDSKASKRILNYIENEK